MGEGRGGGGGVLDGGRQDSQFSPMDMSAIDLYCNRMLQKGQMAVRVHTNIELVSAPFTAVPWSAQSA